MRVCRSWGGVGDSNVGWERVAVLSVFTYMITNYEETVA